MSAIQQLIASYSGTVVSGPNGLVRPMLLSRTGRHMQQQTVLGAAAVVLTYPRVNNPLGSAMIESGNGTTGWLYHDTTVSSCYAGGGESGKTTMALGSSVNGYIKAAIDKTTTAGNVFRFGLVTSGDASDFPNTGLVLCSDSGLYKLAGQYAFATPNGSTTTVPTAGDLIRVTRTGSTYVGAVSQDGGATWVTIHTATSGSTAAVVGFVAIASAGSGVTIGPVTSDVMA